MTDKMLEVLRTEPKIMDLRPEAGDAMFFRLTDKGREVVGQHEQRESDDCADLDNAFGMTEIRDVATAIHSISRRAWAAK